MTTNTLVFISYAQFDDDFEDGTLSRFRDALSRTLRFVSGGEVAIFQEGTGIKIGQPVQERISQSLSEAMVIIPIITPNFFTDPTCQNILTRFLERERQLGRNDLVLAVYYLHVPALDSAQISDDPLVRDIGQRRMLNWQPLRGKDFSDSQVRAELERLARRIIAVLDELQAAPPPILPPQPTSAGQQTANRSSAQQPPAETPTPPSAQLPSAEAPSPPNSGGNPEPVLLTLRFTPTSEGATITWESFAIGTKTSSFAFPYSRADLPLVVAALDAVQHPSHPRSGPQFSADEQKRLQALGLWQNGRVPATAHQLVGQCLYAALIEDRNGELAFSIRNTARSQGQPLTYVLRFPVDAVELAALPWESLWDNRQPILLSSRNRTLDSLERYLDLEEALSPPLPAGKKLHILALSPQADIPQNVRDEERAARTRSWDALKAQGVLDWDELSPVTARALDDRMREEPTPDIIHYYGHGIYKNGQGFLLLDSATTPGQHEFVSAQRLAALLVLQREFPMVS
jgi:hypothetical protein